MFLSQFFAAHALGSPSSSETSSTLCEEELPDILKLNIDCFETKFDYLSLKDLAACSKTCKLMHGVINDFFRDNFPARVHSHSGNIYSENEHVKINCFSKFVKSIILENGELKMFQSNRFQSLKEIEFYGGQLNSIEHLENILGNLETLKFIHCKLKSDIHETFLSKCGNLKRLYVKDDDSLGSPQEIIVGTSNDWLSKTYSSLEHFEFKSRRESNDVIKFLQRNSNIHTFSTTIEFLIENMNLIKKSNIKLNALAIMHSFTKIDDATFDKFMNQLLKLQKEEFFKQLHLYHYITSRAYDYPSDLMPFITVFHIKNVMEKFSISPMSNLENLYILNTRQIRDPKVAMKGLSKLNFIYIAEETFDNIVFLIKSLPNLGKIKVYSIRTGSHFNDATNILNLSTLNNERKKLIKSKKLIIYVPEKCYLATKIAYRQTQLNAIEIKRIESDDTVHDFVNFRCAIV